MQRITTCLKRMRWVGFVLLLISIMVINGEVKGCEVELQSADQFGEDCSEQSNDIVIPYANAIIIAGESNSPSSGTLTLIENEQLLWTMSLRDSGVTSIEGVALFDSTSVVFAGSSLRPSYGYTSVIGKATVSGVLCWLRFYDEFDAWHMFDIVVDSDKDIIVAGGTPFADLLQDALVFKVDSTGNVVWSRAFGNQWSENFDRLALTPCGDIVLAGVGDNLANFEFEIFLAKVSSSGDSIWSQYIPFIVDSSFVWWPRLTVISDTMYVIGVNLSPPDHLGQIQVFAIDSSCNLLWATEFGGPSEDRIYDIHATNANEIWICGSKSDGQIGQLNAFVASLDLNGSITRTLLFEDSLLTLATCMEVVDSCTFVVGGDRWRSYNDRSRDWYILNITEIQNQATPPSNERETSFELTGFPNPFNSTTKFTFDIPRTAQASLKVYDVLGREVQTLLDDVVQTGTRTLLWNPQGITSGIYFARLQSGDVALTTKVALVK